MNEQMNAGRWAVLLLVAGVSFQCGGTEFTAGGANEGTGGLGKGGSRPNQTVGGSQGVGNETSSGGAGDEPAEPAPGGTTSIEPEPQGGQGTTESGGQPGGGTGVVEPVVPTLDLSECGADAFGTGIQPTLYSTLNSTPAIQVPAIGQLGFVGNGENDYHGGRCGLAINIDQTGDYIKYHYQDNDAAPHFSTRVGTMDFWYRPSYAHTDGLDHHLFSTANWDTAGGFRIRKAAANNANSFQVIFRSLTLDVTQIEVPASDYAFTPNEWVRITFIWSLAPDRPRRFAQLFFDGTLVRELVFPPTFQMAPDEGGYFVLGAWTFGDATHAAGMLDDFKVFPRGP